MPLNPDIRDQAYQFFIEEAQELLQVLETGLLELRHDHSTPKVHELMRAAHSIKGGAASVELSAIELLAHRLEDFFKALYSDQVDFDAELEGLLLQGYDCLSNPLKEQIAAGVFDEEAALLTAEPVFQALEVRLETALQNADNYIPSSNDLGVDIVASIFEVDVTQALEHLQTVAAQPQNYALVEELTGTLEMFAGFAELFNLPGLSEIVQTAQTALQNNPHQAPDILKATLADCTLAQEQILAGDRDQGGTVSGVLRELTNISSERGEEPALPLDSEDDLWSGSVADDPLAAALLATLEEDTETPANSPETMLSENTAGAEIPLESDLLWSGATEPVVEDIFDTFAVDSISEVNDEQTTSPREIDAATEPSAANQESQDDLLNFAELTLEEQNLWDASPNSQDEIAPAAELTPETAELPELSDELSQIFGIIPDAAPENSPDTSDTSAAPADLLTEIFEGVETPQAETNHPPEALAQLWPDLAEPIPTPEPSLINPQPPHPEATAANLNSAIESIGEIFESLPNLAQEPESLALKPEAAALKKPESIPTQPPTSRPKVLPKLSVRVDLERLERMSNLVGELTINRNSLALQNNQLQDNVKELGRKFSRFRDVTRKVREISDQMLLEQTPSAPIENRASTLAESSDEFDSLEMDSYNQLHTSLQEALEEIVQLEESVEDITIFAQQSNRTINSQRQMLGQMRDELMWVRMLPLDQILQRFPRTLRELSNKYHKSVELKLNGTGVLVDKAVLEKLSDPLLHLLRNGFDHGIEPPDERAKQGKAATGTIEIQAYHQGNQTVIEVRDDGKGLDLTKITRKGIEQGLISPEEAEIATPERIFELIFEPGFSTASQVSEISGRGVGMNIVRSQIETLKGKITVSSNPGQGSTFTLRLPLTLTIAKLLVCSLGATAFAMPSDSIEEIVIPTAQQLQTAQGQKFLSFNSQLIPVYQLQEVLQYNCPLDSADSYGKGFKTIAPPEDWLPPLLLVRRGQQLFALEIVSLLSEQELVIKPYGKAIAAPPYSYGCTILSDGSLIPTIDAAALISTILGETPMMLRSTSFSQEPLDLESELSEAFGVAKPEAAALNIATKTIMVVDDSTALRRTMALTLEKAGYRVIQKKDGKEALQSFKQHPEIDLIICDVEMPIMNGFEFLGMRRRDSALSQVPTFMLTSRSGTKHRNLAIQLGANGYFTKPYVEQDFIEEVQKILAKPKQSSDRSSQVMAQTKTVLVIDDSSALRRTLALSLENQGYRVLQGRDGVEGLQQLKEHPETDLVICDIEMPNANGFEFLTSRRQESHLLDIPVVMLTSRGSEKHRSLASSLGAQGFFTKPYVEEEFFTALQAYL